MDRDRIDILSEQVRRSQIITNRSIKILSERIYEERETLNIEAIKDIQLNVANKVDRTEIKTINKNSLIGYGDIDTTPDTLNNDDITTIFDNA